MMKYYKVEIEQEFPNEDKMLAFANGKLVSQGEMFFEKMRKREIIKDAPVFDYFFLSGYGDEDEWEWRLQDVHIGGQVYPSSSFWYISDKCKKLFEQFLIAPDYYFYATKLLYKNEKQDYWIFQFPLNPLQNLSFEKSCFCYSNQDEQVVIPVKDRHEYTENAQKVYLECDKKLGCSKIVLNDKYDILYNPFGGGDTLVSERVKKAMEEEALLGFLFSKTDYEIVIDS